MSLQFGLPFTLKLNLCCFINVNEAFVEIIKDFESRAMQSGSEDPEVTLCLQKCEEYIPGEVDIRVRSVRVLITIM